MQLRKLSISFVNLAFCPPFQWTRVWRWRDGETRENGKLFCWQKNRPFSKNRGNQGRRTIL